MILRWLAFFALGVVLSAALVPAAIVPIGHVGVFLGAVWDTAFNPLYEPYGVRAAWTLYTIKTEDFPTFWQVAVMAAFLPGLIFAFALARESLNNMGWKFWKWR